MPFTRCVGITHNAFDLQHPSFHPNSNYRHVIYFPPRFSPSGLLWLNFNSSHTEKWRRDSRKLTQKKKAFAVNSLLEVRPQQAMSAPGNLWKCKFWGLIGVFQSQNLGGMWEGWAASCVFSNPAGVCQGMVKLEKLGSKELFIPFQNSLGHYLEGNLGVWNPWRRLFIIYLFVLKTFFLATWLPCYFNGNKNKKVNHTSIKSTLKRKG